MFLDHPDRPERPEDIELFRQMLVSIGIVNSNESSLSSDELKFRFVQLSIDKHAKEKDKTDHSTTIARTPLPQTVANDDGSGLNPSSDNSDGSNSNENEDAPLNVNDDDESHPAQDVSNDNNDADDESNNNNDADDEFIHSENDSDNQDVDSDISDDDSDEGMWSYIIFTIVF